MLEVENGEGRAVAELFEQGRDHHGAEAHRVAGDYEEGGLPGEGNADEAVVEGGVRDGWRVLAADCVEHEIERREDEDAPEGGDPEDDFGEFHGVASGTGTSPLLAKDSPRVDDCIQNQAKVKIPTSRKRREKWGTRITSTHTAMLIRHRRSGRRCEMSERLRSRGIRGRWRFRKC